NGRRRAPRADGRAPAEATLRVLRSAGPADRGVRDRARFPRRRARGRAYPQTRRAGDRGGSLRAGFARAQSRRGAVRPAKAAATGRRTAEPVRPLLARVDPAALTGI